METSEVNPDAPATPDATTEPATPAPISVPAISVPSMMAFADIVTALNSKDILHEETITIDLGGDKGKVQSTVYVKELSPLKIADIRENRFRDFYKERQAAKSDADRNDIESRVAEYDLLKRSGIGNCIVNADGSPATLFSQVDAWYEDAHFRELFDALWDVVLKWNDGLLGN